MTGKKCRNSVGHALLGWNVLELMRTTARRNMGSLVNYLLRTAAKQLGIVVVS